jgi:hypothetical protein
MHRPPAAQRPCLSHAQRLVSEDQSEPIAHAFSRTLATEFTLGPPTVLDKRDGQGHPVATRNRIMCTGGVALFPQGAEHRSERAGREQNHGFDGLFPIPGVAVGPWCLVASGASPGGGAEDGGYAVNGIELSGRDAHDQVVGLIIG